MNARHHPHMTILWRLLALLCLALGAVGVFLPVMPTVPFLLLAAAAASRGWPWLDERLLGHEVYGPLIHRWRARRAIPRRAKNPRLQPDAPTKSTRCSGSAATTQPL